MVHDNIQPYPLAVFLMVQNLSYKYQEAFNKEESQNVQKRNLVTDQSAARGQWQFIIKLAGAKRRNVSGSAYAYEARNRQGE